MRRLTLNHLNPLPIVSSSFISSPKSGREKTIGDVSRRGDKDDDVDTMYINVNATLHPPPPLPPPPLPRARAQTLAHTHKKSKTISATEQREVTDHLLTHPLPCSRFAAEERAREVSQTRCADDENTEAGKKS